MGGRLIRNQRESSADVPSVASGKRRPTRKGMNRRGEDARLDGNRSREVDNVALEATTSSVNLRCVSETPSA
jgi:hypothetical protein